MTKVIFNEYVKAINEYFAEAVDYSGMTVEEILKNGGVTIEDVCEIMDETGCSVEAAISLVEEYVD